MNINYDENSSINKKRILLSIAGIILILVILLYVILFSKNNVNIFNNNTSKMSGLSWSIDKSS